MVMKKHPAASTRKTKMTTSDLPFTELLLFLFWCLDAKGGEEYLVRLVPVVVWLYLTLAHAMSAFSLSLSRTPALQQQATAFIQKPISISFLFPSQHYHSKLNHFRIYFLDNKIEKTIV
jgi:hypothetical protein